MASSTDIPLLSWRLAVAPPAAAPEQEKEHFLCSTDPALFQLDALHAAMASGVLYWAKPLAPEQLRAMVANSVCLALYRLNAGTQGTDLDMVGFARLVTDRVTFAYLTDVYVLPAYQRRGLGRWMLRCLREVVHGNDSNDSNDNDNDNNGNPSHPGWPDLRRLWLVTSNADAARLYADALGAETVAPYRTTPGAPDRTMFLMEMKGRSDRLE